MQRSLHEIIAEQSLERLYEKSMKEKLYPNDPLTPRESEVATMFSIGYDENQIAEELNISPETIRTHLKAIYVKLNVHNRHELFGVFITRLLNRYRKPVKIGQELFNTD